jgi:DNA-binding NtrC family response regulator
MRNFGALKGSPSLRAALLVVDLGSRREPGGVVDCGMSEDVQELANVLERAAILAEGERLSAQDLHMSLGKSQVGRTLEGPQTMAEAEETAIRGALAVEGRHRRRAAELRGIGERPLNEDLKQCGMR